MPQDWLIKFLWNLIGYATICIPIVIIVFLVKNEYCYPSLSNCVFLRLFVFGRQNVSTQNDLEQAKLIIETDVKVIKPNNVHPKPKSSILTFMFCFIGLNSAYLVWGVYQEKIMTTDYIDSTNKKIRFSDSQSCVLINRVFAFIFGSILCIIMKSEFNAPIYIFIFASLSNVISSWCQYEALKFVNFPTQVLSKACKVPCVMLTSTFVGGKKYSISEYLCAVVVSLGMTVFLLGDNSLLSSDLANGLLVLIIYLAFDSFTSNWQEKIFSSYSVSCFAMMSAINAYSILLTSTSMAEQGDFYQNLTLLNNCWSLQRDLFILATFGLIGQLFVFHTVRIYGALVFTGIMMVRQFLAIALSSFIYGHNVNWLGVIIVFGGLIGLKFVKIGFKLDKIFKSSQNFNVLKSSIFTIFYF